MIFYFREYFPLKLLVDLDNRGEGDSVNRPRLIPTLKSVINVSRVHFLLVILHKLPSVCSLCISYLHWINVSHWWQVFKSMFINGFFKCLKIKSLTYWWSFRSCPGREKEPELERVWRAAELTPAATEQEAGGRKEEAEDRKSVV